MSFNIESVVCLAYRMYSLSCGILDKKYTMLVTSIDTRIVFSGTLVLSMKLMESVDCISLGDTTSVVVLTAGVVWQQMLITSLLDLKLSRSPKSVCGFS